MTISITTRYFVKGDKETLDRLYESMEGFAEFNRADRIDKGKNLAHFRAALDGKEYVPGPDDKRGGRISRLERTEDGGVGFHVTALLPASGKTASGEVEELSEALRSRFPGVRVLFLTEDIKDGETDGWWTNDVGDEHFHDS